jgi:Holliday junction DNA helicase RuvA
VIVKVHGVLEAVGPDWAHIRVGGVTLQVFVPASSIAGLGSLGASVGLHTELRIRDEQPVLFGFTSPDYLTLFQLLNAVSGVGPRLSLALLSALGATGLQQAISNEDITALASAPGVGRRIAGRIVLELKGKLDPTGDAAIPTPLAADSEVIAALTALGYSPNEARSAVAGLDKDPELTVEDRIRLALQQFGASGA